MDNTPLVPAAANVIVGVAFDNTKGAALDNVSVPDAAIVVAPAIDPAFVIFPELLFNPPVIDAPPVETVNNPPIVCAVVKLLFCPLYATFVNVPVILISARQC